MKNYAVSNAKNIQFPIESRTSKLCKKCGVIGRFHIRFNKKGEATIGSCFSCAKLYQRTDKSRELRLDRKLKKLYGIDIATFRKMEIEQDKKCAICSSITPKRLHVDHCHKTGLVRKLLCKKCNFAIGLVNEDVNILKNMIDYIEKHKS